MLLVAHLEPPRIVVVTDVCGIERLLDRFGTKRYRDIE
jgi:hypothetical protein